MMTNPRPPVTGLVDVPPAKETLIRSVYYVSVDSRMVSRISLGVRRFSDSIGGGLYSTYIIERYSRCNGGSLRDESLSPEDMAFLRGAEC